MGKVYVNCKVYGPYTFKQDGRQRVIIHLENGKKRFLSYPKYLVEMYLDRYLDEDDTVDHIDGNFLNNDLSNLRVVKRKQHCFEDAVIAQDVKTTCKWCGNEFIIPGNKIRQRNRKKNKASGFCSKSCTGKYGAYVQNGGETFDKAKLESVYIKRKSALKVISIVEDQNIGEFLTGDADDNAEA